MGVLVGLLQLLLEPVGLIFSGCLLNGSVQGGFCVCVLVLLGLVSVLDELPGVHGDPGLLGFGGLCVDCFTSGVFHGLG